VKKSLVLFIALFVATISIAQNDTITIEKSTDKVMIGGQIYYVHIVKQGETLFSLSKAYEVSQKDIAKENPEIFLGLQIGQALKIPFYSNEKEKLDKDKKSFIYHKVKKGQTLYALSKKYNVNQEDIMLCNPTVRYGININQIIKIPKSKEVVEAIQKFPTSKNVRDTVRIVDDFIYHTVVKQETVYSLIRNYEITEDILNEYNPTVKEGLQIGQVLKIPKVISMESETVLFRSDSLRRDTTAFNERTLVAYSDSAKFDDCQKINDLSEEKYQVAVMLPFYLENNDEEFYVDSSEYDDNGKKIYERVYYSPYYIYPKSVGVVEFYEGLLLSVDSLRKTGLSINLNVYDTRNDTAKIQELLNDPEMQTMDLIIGPIYNQEIKLVSQFSKAHGINMVSPLLPNLNFVYDNPNLFQVYPSYEAQIEEFAKYISTFQDKNIVIVHDGDSIGYSNIQMVKERIFSYLSVDTIVNNIQFKEVVFKDSINVFEHALDKDISNIFVIPSNNEAFVTDVLTKLNTLKTFGSDVQVVGLSRWQRFSNVDPEYYFNLNLSLASPFFIDYHHDDVKKFVLKYRDVYKTEPAQMAIHGYDVGLYFLSALKDYGKSFSNCIVNYDVDLLQAKYKFVKWYENSGFENTGVDMIKYYDGYNIFRISEIEDLPISLTENKIEE
jgi:LysM repeat protein/ABC-type branched-subunit amino acid transport system substrate-binding protein